MSDAALVPPRRAVRLLQRLGLRGRLVVERLDGAPVSEADLTAVREAIAEINDLEAQAERATGGTGSGDP